MKKILILFSLFFIVIACNDDFLDVNPKDRVSETDVWTDPSLVSAYHNALYNGIPHGFSRHMISKYTDEAFSNGDNVQRNTFDADNIFSYRARQNYLYFWQRGYLYIRKINIFIEEMEDPQITLENVDVLIAEAKFVRAFINFELIRRYGGVPIIEKSYEIGEEINFERSSFDDCVAFINKDLEEAIAVLPKSHATTSADFGRGTQDACKALQSRMLLYAASPLFNTSDDMGKWQLAADAAEELLNAGYSLYPDYRQMFIQPSGSENSGLIFARNFSSTNSHQAPIINMNRRYGGYGGWGATNGPTQNLVDSYPMTNGELPFLDSEGENINPDAAYDPQNPYANRDSRLEATILHNGSVYRGDTMEMWISDDAATYGFDSFRQSGDNPRSNYVLKKFAPDEDVALSFQTPYTMPWVYFRLAEIYLNYAEAKFELGDEETCRQYINMVRARPSVATSPVDNNVSGEALRRVLYNERRVEFAFEGQRFFDMRRWKLDNEEFSTDLRGMEVIKNTSTGEIIYTPFVLGEREPFEDKMYLLPIHTDEILKSSGLLEQTDGW
ncbi:RagB/SusD family nutrient uptake outer membrane protein [Flavivirga jejuensis]|uniref:RagB/SusD family nutrient uptake outer membrane protein n=1 Tax=Flavivirga jejuensis TaxID=870487 RepID=A0ABT8WLK4_9FLAO|nr:RagB/SusD family nutrient uptake outer membrane protein [Flavivirga jejuensis]MDO5974042.1 RagB/SusD family nutrient uptake outer membrane protein [Flavivirga jejuensis]